MYFHCIANYERIWYFQIYSLNGISFRYFQTPARCILCTNTVCLIWNSRPDAVQMLPQSDYTVLVCGKLTNNFTDKRLRMSVHIVPIAVYARYVYRNRLIRFTRNTFNSCLLAASSINSLAHQRERSVSHQRSMWSKVICRSTQKYRHELPETIEFSTVRQLRVRISHEVSQVQSMFSVVFSWIPEV